LEQEAPQQQLRLALEVEEQVVEHQVFQQFHQLVVEQEEDFFVLVVP
jgi:hypothetical protein